MFTVILLFITQEITLTNHIGASLANLCMPTKNVCVTEDYSDTQGYLSSVLFTHSLPLHHSQLHWHSPLVSRKLDTEIHKNKPKHKTRKGHVLLFWLFCLAYCDVNPPAAITASSFCAYWSDVVSSTLNSCDRYLSLTTMRNPIKMITSRGRFLPIKINVFDFLFYWRLERESVRWLYWKVFPPMALRQICYCRNVAN